MINMDYLKGRLVQAKAADSDVVRIGIEEFEELIEEINERSIWRLMRKVRRIWETR